MFGQDLFILITFKTSCYRLEIKPSIKSLTKTEITQVFRIHLFSSVVQLSNICQYWSDKLCIASIAGTMTRDRFEEIMSFLHLCDNSLQLKENEENSERLYEGRPMLNILEIHFMDPVDYELCLAVDKQIIPFKGKHSIKVYIKN